MIHIVRGGKGGLLLVPVYGGTGSEEQMFRLEMPAGFQNVEEPHNVGIDVFPGMVDAVADPGLGRQVHHNVRPEIPKDPVHRFLVRQVSLGEGKGRVQFQPGQPVLLQLHIVIGVHVVHSGHPGPQGQQPSGQVIADKAGGSGDQDFLVGVKRFHNCSLVPVKQVPGIDFVFHICQIL